MNLFFDFKSLFFPNTCYVCGKSLGAPKLWMCNTCMMDIPLTGFWDLDQNPMEQKFWGLLPLKGACALMHFSKGSRYVNLIYSLKYYKHWRVAQSMGRYLGYILKDADKYKDVDYIIPVPLHYRRRLKRGYNQAEYIAKGLAEIMGAKVDAKTLKRVVHNPTQTKKDKYQRWKNVENIFAVGDTTHLKGKHILLVDDVLTTGSTIVSCADSLLKQQSDITLSVATLACRVDIPGKGAIDDDFLVVKI
ncbi:MAG: phosphoribosyltransferase family protein [Rikenellaceae bacterium]